MKKKGQLENLGGLVTTLVFLGILFAVVLLIVAEVRDQAIAVGGAESYAHNGTTEIIGAINDIPDWLPI